VSASHDATEQMPPLNKKKKQIRMKHIREGSGRQPAWQVGAHKRRGGGGGKARNTGHRRGTAALPSHETRAVRCDSVNLAVLPECQFMVIHKMAVWAHACATDYGLISCDAHNRC
jgi:hypothetical protein